MPHPISADAEGAHLGRRVLLRGSGRGQKFSFIILLDYSTISNMCFVCGCVFICVFCLGLWLGEGWMEGRRRGREFRGIGRLHVGRMLTDTAPHCQSTFLHSAPQLEC